MGDRTKISGDISQGTGSDKTTLLKNKPILEKYPNCAQVKHWMGESLGHDEKKKVGKGKEEPLKCVKKKKWLEVVRRKKKKDKRTNRHPSEKKKPKKEGGDTDRVI